MSLAGRSKYSLARNVYISTSIAIRENTGEAHERFEKAGVRAGPFTVFDSSDNSLQGAFQQLAPDPLGRFQVFGDEGRNVVAGPGYVDWDFSAFKNIKVTESEELQFRAEFFNLLNHTNFRLPVSDISSPDFGQIQADVSPRVIQLALKFLF